MKTILNYYQNITPKYCQETHYNYAKNSGFKAFTFTGKERDSETGYSYFGARYYDSDLMTGWLSVDPQSDKFPNISPYNYCNWNPVKLKDSDGEVPVKPLVSVAKIVYKAYKIYKKTGKLTMNSLKKAGLNELVSIVDDINTIFSEDASFEDRFIACVDLVVGTELNNGKNNIVSTLGKKKGSLSETKSALSKVKKKLNIENTSSLPKGKGKFGSPMRGDAKKGYRLDPAHPNAEPGSGEEYPHINYWDYTEKKRSLGGIKGVEPIKK